VHLLLQYGGDPLLTDSQGFNILHLATHSSNIMLILYLLHQPLIVPDLTDPQEHTPIMWAAYQGDALSVDVLLRWGADVKKRDNAGLTALHWAVVRGNKMCMRRLLEEGSDIHALTNEGKSPVMLAEEMKCSLVLQRALHDSGRYDEDGNPRLKPRFTNDVAKKIIFCAPFVILNVTLLMIVHNMGGFAIIVDSTILSFLLPDSRMALRLQFSGSESSHPGSSRRQWPNPQDTISGRYLLRHCGTRRAQMDFYSTAMYYLVDQF